LISDLVPAEEVSSISDDKAVEILKSARCDIIIVFGTGKIPKEIISLYPGRIMNLHGGNPEEYRGLDSHLWTIYNNDFENLITTLHHVNEKIDDGDIISQETIRLKLGDKLHQLRSINTNACLKLVLEALKSFQQKGKFAARPQVKKGKYYSFMPTEHKGTCVENFEKYIGALC